MSSKDSENARRAALQNALQGLDPQTLEAAADRLPKLLGQQAKALATQLRSGRFEPKALEGLLEPTLAALRTLREQQPTTPRPESATTDSILAGILERLTALQARCEDSETRSALIRALASGDALAGSLNAASASMATQLASALRALSPDSEPQELGGASKQAAEQAVQSTAVFLGNLGAAAQHAENAQEPISSQLSQVWLAALQGLPGSSNSPLHQAARSACLQHALKEKDLARVSVLTYDLVQVAMDRKDWQGAAVYQHHLADLAESLGLMEEAVRARLKEALLLARTERYAGSAEVMVEEQLRLTADAPTGIRALVALHAGDVASVVSGPKAALRHWKSLLRLEGVRKASPEAEIRAHLSIGYAILESKAKRAAQHFRDGWTLSFSLKNWELFGLAVEGLVLSQARAGLHRKNRLDHQTVRQQAADWVGPEGVRRVDSLWEQHLQ